MDQAGHLVLLRPADDELHQALTSCQTDFPFRMTGRPLMEL
jgi:hypothetical protein